MHKIKLEKKFKIFFGAIFVCLFLIADILIISHFLSAKNGLDDEARLIQFSSEEDLKEEISKIRQKSFFTLKDKAIKAYGEDMDFATSNEEELENFKKQDAKNAYRVLNFRKDNNKEAQKILYDYMSDKYVLEGEKRKIEDIRAVFIDLNDDGIDEIIGETAIWPAGGKFVLGKKADGTYKRLGDFGLDYCDDEVYVLNKKVNNYRVLVTYAFYRIHSRRVGLYLNKYYGYR